MCPAEDLSRLAPLRSLSRRLAPPPGGSPAGRTAGLAERLRSGHPGAVEELVRGCGVELLTVARRLLVDEQEARQAVQAALLRALEALPGILDEGEHLPGWLRDHLVRAILLRARRSGPRSERAIGALLPRFSSHGGHASPIEEWQVSASGGALQRDTRGRVRAATGRIPAPYRVVLILHDAEALGLEEVAQLLILDVREVRSRLHRARQSLQTQLAAIFERPRPPEPSSSLPVSALRPVV